MSDKISIAVDIDLDKLKKSIEKAEKLDDDNKVFEELSSINLAKIELKKAVDQLVEIDNVAKQKINDRAKAVIGVDWSAIEGSKYKITRSKTGAKYEILDPKKASKFIETKYAPKTKDIEKYQKEKSALPDGIAPNDNRGESITITLK